MVSIKPGMDHDRSSESVRNEFIPASEADRAISMAKINADTHDVFVGVAPRSDRKGARPV